MQYQEENYESLDKLEASLTKTKLKWKISGSDKRLNWLQTLWHNMMYSYVWKIIGLKPIKSNNMKSNTF